MNKRQFQRIYATKYSNPFYQKKKKVSGKTTSSLALPITKNKYILKLGMLNSSFLK